MYPSIILEDSVQEESFNISFVLLLPSLFYLQILFAYPDSFILKNYPFICLLETLYFLERKLRNDCLIIIQCY